jgi:hypothetical protein
MKQLLLAIIILGGLTLTVPALRERAAPPAERFSDWAGEKLEGPLSPLLTPYRNTTTRARMSNFISALVRERNQGYPPPQPSEFLHFLVRKELSDAGLDAWGTPYTMKQAPDSVHVMSAGADRTFDTEDDIIVSLRYHAPEPTRGRRPRPRGR